jgi:alanine-synthesizing transaminase
MFVWARIPEAFAHLGSLEFTKLLMKEGHVALSPGIGFGPMGEGFVRFSLIEENDRLRQATHRIGEFLQGEHAGVEVSSAPVHV